MTTITIRYATQTNTAETLAAAMAEIRKVWPNAVDVSGSWIDSGNGRETRQIVEFDSNFAPLVAELSRPDETERAVNLCREIFGDGADDGATVKLTKGQRYDLDLLRCVDWTGDDTGLDCWAYFADGVYLGPDADGVEPLFVVR